MLLPLLLQLLLLLLPPPPPPPLLLLVLLLLLLIIRVNLFYSQGDADDLRDLLANGLRVNPRFEFINPTPSPNLTQL